MSARNNVVLIFSDQQHASAQGSVDPWFMTPSLDRFAAEAVTFTHAYCTTPQCTPSRGSILTGLFPHRTGVLGNIGAAGGNELSQPTIAHELNQAGYRVGYFGKWHLGDHKAAASGFDRRNLGHNDPRSVENALAWLADQPDSAADQPFALIVSFNQPHDVYRFDPDTAIPDEGSIALPRSWHEDDLSSKPQVQLQFLTDDQGRKIYNKPIEAYQRYRAAYRSCVRDYDHSLGLILDALRSRADWSRTGVLVFSDHGDMDAHHRLCFKGPFMYDQMVRVPLHVRLPDHMQPGVRINAVDDLVSLVDVRATALDIAGCLPRFGQRDGLSLLPACVGDTTCTRREAVVSEYYSKQEWVNPIRMVADRRFKYVRYQKWGEELYDLQADPDEINNLAHHPDYAAARDALRERLTDWQRETGDNFESHWPTSRTGEPLPR